MQVKICRRDIVKSLALSSVAMTSTGYFTARAFAVSAGATQNLAPPVGVHTVAQADLDLLFLSGATVLDLYHRHPHRPIDEVVSADVRAQVHMTMRNIFEVLDNQGLGWNNVVKFMCYVKNMKELPAIREVMARYFGEWRPAVTAIQVEQLSSNIARFELEMIAVAPRTNG